jgi:hypothetical protein
MYFCIPLARTLCISEQACTWISFPGTLLTAKCYSFYVVYSVQYKVFLVNTNQKFAHPKNVLHVSSVERHLAGTNIENMFEICAFLEYYVA